MISLRLHLCIHDAHISTNPHASNAYPNKPHYHPFHHPHLRSHKLHARPTSSLRIKHTSPSLSFLARAYSLGNSSTLIPLFFPHKENKLQEIPSSSTAQKIALYRTKRASTPSVDAPPSVLDKSANSVNNDEGSPLSPSPGTNALCWALMFQLPPTIKECGNINQSLP